MLLYKEILKTMKKVKFSREELYEMVWDKPLNRLVTKLNISVYELKQECKKFEIPLPPMGYWMKLQYGKNVEKIPSPISTNDNTIEIYTKREGLKIMKKSNNPKVDQLVEEISNNMSLPIRVPKRLTSQNPIVISTKNYIERVKRNQRES
jgi:hypothetical protein